MRSKGVEVKFGAVLAMVLALVGMGMMRAGAQGGEIYEVWYNANGGTPGMQGVTVTNGMPYVLPEVEPVFIEGYVLRGWYTASFGGMRVTEGTVVEQSVTHTNYAQWAAGPAVYDVEVKQGTGMAVEVGFEVGIDFAGGDVEVEVCVDGRKVGAVTKQGVRAGNNVVEWDAGTVYPNGFAGEVSAVARMVTGMWSDVEGAEYVEVDLENVAANGRAAVMMWSGDVLAERHRTTHMLLKRVSAGTFMMGSGADETGRSANETQHEVTLTRDFFVGVYEVTQKQWELVMGTKPASGKGDGRPVEWVSHGMVRGDVLGARWPADNGVDAASFMGRLRGMVGLGFDLPTEAQWEYACRAGMTTALNSGEDLADVNTCANLAELGRYAGNQGDDKGEYASEHTTVGSYRPNAWGLYDMHGNVGEWCLDWYEEGQGAMARTDPWGAEAGFGRITRGGSYHDAASGCRAAARSFGGTMLAFDRVGFRVAVVPEYVAGSGALAVDTRTGFDVVFSGNGGEPATQVVVVTNGFVYGLPAMVPERTGYGFAGWFTEAEGGTEVVPATVVTGLVEHVVHARWQGRRYEVAFDARGGTVTNGTVSMTVTFGEAMGELPEAVLEGHAFEGWFTEAEGGTEVVPATVVTVAGDHAVYARWRQTVFSVALDMQGGTPGDGTGTVVLTLGEPVGVLPEPERKGHVFAGWFTEEGGAGTRVEPEMIWGGEMLYAAWRAAAYLSDAATGGGVVPGGTGAYAGFVYDGEGKVAGTLVLTARESRGKWWFTAKVAGQSGTLSFTAREWTGGVAGELAMTRKRTGETLTLRVEEGRVWGVLGGGKVEGVLTVDGARNVFADRRNAAAQARLAELKGQYNAALVEQAAAGGYLTLRVGNLGTVKFAGRLADGTTVTAGSRLLEGLNENGWVCAALHKPLNGRTGYVSGLVWVDGAQGALRVDAGTGWHVDWLDGKTGAARAFEVCGGRFEGWTPEPGMVFGVDVPEALPPGLTGVAGEWMRAALPDALPVTVSGTRMALPKATAPRKVEGVYDYSGANPSGARLMWNARTGVFRGTFKMYYDGLADNGMLRHKTATVSYTGVVTPVRAAEHADWPLGMGAGAATINRMKTSASVYLWKDE